MQTFAPLAVALLLCPALAADDDLILSSASGQPHDVVTQFGSNVFGDVAADGDRLALGAGNATVNGNTWQGLVTLWRRVGQVWQEEAVVSASEGDAVDRYGSSVALSGDVLVVGAPNAKTLSGNSNDGSAWVHRWDGSAWQQEQRLKQSFGSDLDEYGSDVAVHGDFAVVGAPGWGDEPFFESAGRAFVYRFDGNAWVNDGTLIGTSDPFEYFGTAVAVHGDWAMVGAPGSAPFPAPAPKGAVYAFQRDDVRGWQLAQIVQADEGTTGGSFGWSVAFDGERLVAGDPSHGQHGAVFVFEFDGSEWTQQARLVVETSGQFNHLGVNVAVQGDAVLSGLPADAIAGVSGQGSVWAFRQADGAWDSGLKLTGSSGQGASTFFGRSVAVLDDAAVVLSPGSLEGQGTLHLIELPGAAWFSLGHALAGGNDLPGSKQLGALTPGSPLALNLDRALPDSFAVLVVGADTLDAPFKGGVLVPTPTLLRAHLTDSEGSLELGLRWPAGVPAGFEVFTQWWIADVAGALGYAASNAVRGTAH